MAQYGDKLRESLGPAMLSLEEAQQMKREARSQREFDSRDLEVLAAEYQRKGDAEYYANMSTAQRIVCQVKEFFGRGRDYEYRQHLNELGVMSNQLKVLAENTLSLANDYRVRVTETRSGMAEDREVFVLNSIIYTEKDRLLNETRENLSGLERQSVLGSSATSEAIGLHKRVLEIENDLTMLSGENDDLAVRIMVNNSVYETQRQASSKLLQMYGQIQRQRTVFDAHYELARSQQKMVDNLHGVSSAAEVYIESAVQVQQLKRMQEGLQHSGVEQLPEQFAIQKVNIKPGEETGRPYWMTVADQIRAIGKEI